MAEESGVGPQGEYLFFKDPEYVPQVARETQIEYSNLMNNMRASRDKNGDFFADMGMGKGNTQALVLKEARKNQEPDKLDFVIFTRLGVKIVTTSEEDFNKYVLGQSSAPFAGLYIGERGNARQSWKGVAFKYGIDGKIVPIRDVTSEDDKKFVNEALLNSIRAGKTRLAEREVKWAEVAAEDQKKKLPKGSKEIPMAVTLSTIVNESAHPSLPFRH